MVGFFTIQFISNAIRYKQKMNILDSYIKKIGISIDVIDIKSVIQIFNNASADFINKRISNSQFSQLIGHLLYNLKYLDEITGNNLDLGRLMSSCAELDWYSQNDPSKYEQIIVNIKRYIRNISSQTTQE